MNQDWQPVPLAVRTDPAHGGRWTSLRAADREWLWTNPDPAIARARAVIAPGAAFVDAGGVEECLPTVRGVPDHGDAWTRAWATGGTAARVEVPSVGRLARSISGSDRLVIDYLITGAPGTAFVHAVHALLDLSPRARLEIAGPRRMRVLDVPDPGGPDPDRPWPEGLDRLGPDDGTAVCVLLTDCHRATVVDGDRALEFSWTSPDAPDLCSLLLWRNLRGWPAERPYRSIGIEPMVGRTADLSAADPADCVRLGPTGRFRWTLTLTAYHHSEFGGYVT